MTTTLLLIAEVCLGTSDVGEQCTLVAVSRDGRYAVSWCCDINDGSGLAEIVDLANNATRLQSVEVTLANGSPFQSLPADVVSKYGLSEPPAPAPCSPDGRFCVRVLPTSIQRGPSPKLAEEGEPESYVPTVWGSFAVELITGDESIRIYEGSTRGYGGKDGGGTPPALQAQWLPGHVAILGYIYSETRPQWGNLEALRVFWKLPADAPINRAETGRALYAAAVEFARKNIPWGANDYLQWAATMDQRSAPVVCSVTGVAANDMLNVREEPSPSSAHVGQIPPSATTVRKLGPVARVGRREWALALYDDVSGWVNGAFLTCPRAAQQSGAKP